MEGKRIKELEAELTCAICEEHYSDPRLLPCMHYYCKSCIQDLINSQSTETRCPECRREFEPVAADSLNPAFFVHRLQDLHRSLSLAEVTTIAQQPSSTIECGMCSPSLGSRGSAISICWTCKRFVCESCELVHERVKDYEGHQIASIPGNFVPASPTPTQVLTQPSPSKGVWCNSHQEQCKIYCLKCEELLCTVCKVLRHNDHDCAGILECSSKCKETLKFHLESVHRCKSMVSITLKGFEERKEAVSAKASVVCNEIMGEFEKLRDVVDKAREEALQRVHALEAEKLTLINAKMKHLEMAMSDLSSTLQTAVQLLSQASADEYLLQHKEMVHQIGSVVAQQLDLKLSVDANIQMEMDESILQLVTESCLVSTMQPDPTQCTASGPGIDGAHNERKNTFILQLAYSTGEPCTEEQSVNVTVCPVADRKLPEVDVLVLPCSVNPGSYMVSYTPHTRGWLQIDVTVNGNGISGSPFKVFATAHPSDLHLPVRVIDVRTQLDGLTITSDDNLVVSEKNRSEVSIWSSEGKKIRVIKVREFLHGKHTLCCPTGVAIDPLGCIYIADNKSHSLLKLSPDGDQLLKSIEVEGSGPGQLKSPGGVRISSKGEVYVCDCQNHRIQVFNKNLQFLRSFGRKGTDEGEFTWPVDLVFDSKGYMYISDMDNHRIQVFNQAEMFVQSFGQKGKDPGFFNRPVFMFLDANDFLYISENENHRVSVFKTTGKFVTILGGWGTEEGNTKSPKGITMDKRGFLYVGERGNKRIQVF